MEGGQHSKPVSPATAGPTTVRAQDADVAELRPVEILRVCQACLVSNSAADAFCTACGASLHVVEQTANEQAEAVNDGLLAATQGKRPAVSASSPQVPEDTLVAATLSPAAAASTSRHGRSRIIVATLLAAIGVASLTVFAILWQSESDHATRLETRLDSSEAQLRATQSKLAATQTNLAATSSLSARRRLVLIRAQTVLTKVDPLLSDADGLKQITTQIQAARDAFAADSAQMTTDLLALENYEANPQNYPAIDQSSLANQVNAELGLVRSDYTTLTSSDGSFSTASTTFGTHADAFTTAVRGLQKQLNGVAGP